MDAAKARCQELFGRRLRELRRRKRKTQQAVSELAGLHRHFVSDVERGVRNPTVETIARLAYALRVSPAELFAGFTADELDSLFGSAEVKGRE